MNFGGIPAMGGMPMNSLGGGLPAMPGSAGGMMPLGGASVGGPMGGLLGGGGMGGFSGMSGLGGLGGGLSSLSGAIGGLAGGFPGGVGMPMGGAGFGLPQGANPMGLMLQQPLLPPPTQRYGKIMGMPTAQFVDRLFASMVRTVFWALQERQKTKLMNQQKAEKARQQAEAAANVAQSKTNADVNTPSVPSSPSTVDLTTVDAAMARLNHYQPKDQAQSTITDPITRQVMQQNAQQAQKVVQGNAAMAQKIVAQIQKVDKQMSGTGNCAKAVGDALEDIGIKIRRMSTYNPNKAAYYMADSLKEQGDFEEISADEAQPGDILVFGPSKGHPLGHTSVYLGNGQEASDFQRAVKSQDYSWTKAFRYVGP